MRFIVLLSRLFNIHATGIQEYLANSFLYCNIMWLIFGPLCALFVLLHPDSLMYDHVVWFRIIQSFIVREQSGTLDPPSFDENRIRQSRKGGVMGSVFLGKNRSSPEINLELSLEMNRKMQCVLEDTLLKNITLKVQIFSSILLLLLFKKFIIVICICRKILIHWVRKFREYQHSCRNMKNHPDSISGILTVMTPALLISS